MDPQARRAPDAGSPLTACRARSDATIRRLAGPIRAPYHRLVRAGVPWRLARARGRLDEPAVALTFDDGPHPVFTPAVLDVLARHGVHATFFLVGRNARRHPALVRRIADEGHGLASHSMTHPDPWQQRPVALWRDYRDGHLAVSEVVGRDVRLFRPPKGHLDRRGAVAIRAAGLRTQLWTLDAADWEPGLRPEQLLDRLGRPDDGEVILLHDAIERPLAPAASDRSAMVAGLTQFLARSGRDGVRFVTLG